MQGANLIGMLESVLGKEGLKAGLKAYLSKHAYGNAVTRDLWESLGKVNFLSVFHKIHNTSGKTLW